ncbi:hypothetical protein POL68_08780 [Stigmatella sp. ncwal1]|uniref:Membrane protein YczE n=1 Tax=Stigmatella ashevillensis TaxID=2995309 RepID=A0ABT5D4H8_9BACT|nr:hypothetical protein [Stigmatella ashevillena]MDC0708562.1 hypothetical protein [Stigmatella ashevillena]
MDLYWKRFSEFWAPRFEQVQYFLYLLGCVLFSFGANFFIASHLGTDPLDVMALGLIQHVPWMTVGMAHGGFAALCLGVWAIWNRKAPPLSPFVTFFLCGSLIDLWMHIQVANAFLFLPPFPMMLIGVVLCAYGSSLIIMSGIGIRAMDLVAISMVNKWRLPFWASKGALEVLLLVSGWILGGPIGIGTLFFLAFVGWLIQPLMWANNQFLKLRNYGLEVSQSGPTSQLT